MRTVYGQHERFKEIVLLARTRALYFTGDGCQVATKTATTGSPAAIDDVINVSGHRMGTAEVESALVSYPAVAEAAVVGYPHEIKGQGIYAYVTLKDGQEYTDELLKEHAQEARPQRDRSDRPAPDVIHWAPGLPKTRSGKIMRRILRKIAEGQAGPDRRHVSTLADPSVVENLIKNKPSARIAGARPASAVAIGEYAGRDRRFRSATV